jgi:cytochrome c oxidase subunit 2
LPFLSTVLRVLHPQSPQSRAIFDLGVSATIILSLIFVIVTGVVVYALVRYRWREGEPDPHQHAGNKMLELVWTGIPLLIVAGLFFLTARAMRVSDPPPAPAPDLIVTGHQWWWEADYPVSGVVVANEIHIPVGRPWSVQLKTADVLHEFWVPELARKITAVPGHPNHIWIEADKPGVYHGFCSEFCGTQHAWMQLRVVAQTAAEFAAWIQTQQQPAAPPAGAGAIQGRALFESLTCVNCHAIAGTVAEARVGPDLTHFASRRQLGAGVVPNTPENLHRWLADPQQVKPGVKMPDFKFTPAQLSALVAYLETLR